MGWATMPRKINDPNDHELVKAVAVLIKKIVNDGKIPKILSCTRLIVLNKTPHLTPDL